MVIDGYYTKKIHRTGESYERGNFEFDFSQNPLEWTEVVFSLRPSYMYIRLFQ